MLQNTFLLLLFALLCAGCVQGAQFSKPAPSPTPQGLEASVALFHSSAVDFTKRHPDYAVSLHYFTAEEFSDNYRTIQAQCGPLPLRNYTQVALRGGNENLFLIVDAQARSVVCSSAQPYAPSYPPAPLVENTTTASSCVPLLLPYSQEGRVFARQLFFNAIASGFCACASRFDDDIESFRYQQLLKFEPSIAAAAEKTNASRSNAQRELRLLSGSLNSSNLNSSASTVSSFKSDFADFYREDCAIEDAWFSQLRFELSER
ncbi:MAG TPA: hypothetical protein VGQ00_04025 [Candidatus Norongarragalinales archaeon]|jgi:hypothetical protein|nr:hypothetical protein [Candidatus Norongarragalinales archaeon]